MVIIQNEAIDLENTTAISFECSSILVVQIDLFVAMDTNVVKTPKKSLDNYMICVLSFNEIIFINQSKTEVCN